MFRRSALILSISVSITAIIAGWVFFTEREYDMFPRRTTEYTASPVETTDTSRTTDSTVWKTYSSERYGFVLRYPKASVPLAPETIFPAGVILERQMVQLPSLAGCQGSVLEITYARSYETEQQWATSPRFVEHSPEYGKFVTFAGNPAFIAL